MGSLVENSILDHMNRSERLVVEPAGSRSGKTQKGPFLEIK